MPEATSSGQHLLLHSSNTQRSRKDYRVMIELSSRDRNYNNVVASNPFRFQFQRPLKEVRSVELISGTIPANPCQINEFNGRFTFQEGTKTWNVTIPPAYYYSAQQLGKTIEGLINALPGKTSSYTFSLEPATYSGTQFQLLSSVPATQFALLFVSGTYPDEIDRSDGSFIQMNTPALLLGFDISDYYSDTSTGKLTSPFLMDLNSTLTRLYLYIDFNNSQSLATVERGSGRRSPFAIIYLDQQTNGYKFLNKETVTPINYNLPQPLSRLQALNIEFRDEFYRLINFNGKDFSLLLQLNCLE